MSSTDELLDRLFEQAREVVLGERDSIDVSFEELADLVSNEVMVARFRARIRLEAQNREARELLVLLLRGMSSKAMQSADHIAVDADVADRYIGRTGIGMIAASVAMLATSGGLGAFALLGAGLAGMVLGGIGSNILRKRSNRLRGLSNFAGTAIEGLSDD